MDKFTNDSNVLAAQNAAFQAAEFESATLDRFMAGTATEAEYTQAMDSTEMACKVAIKAGATYKDLPAH